MLTEVVQYLGGALIVILVVLRVRAKRSDRRRDRAQVAVRPPEDPGRRLR